MCAIPICCFVGLIVPNDALLAQWPIVEVREEMSQRAGFVDSQKYNFVHTMQKAGDAVIIISRGPKLQLLRSFFRQFCWKLAMSYICGPTLVHVIAISETQEVWNSPNSHRPKQCARRSFCSFNFVILSWRFCLPLPHRLCVFTFTRFELLR